MNKFCSVMSHANCILLLQNVRIVQNESILQNNEQCKMNLDFQNVRFMQNESILQCDESCKMHFALAKFEARAKSIHFAT